MHCFLNSGAPPPASFFFGLAMASTATSEALTSNFLTQVQATCNAQVSAIMVCDMSDITIKRCNADLTCDNSGSVNTYTCSPQEVVTAVLAAAGQTAIPDDVAASMAALTAGFADPPGLPSNASPAVKAMAQYISTRCSESVIAAQAVSLPQLQLLYCKSDRINLLNQLDANVRCSVSAISELVPPDPLPTTYPTPIWKEPLQLSLVLGGAMVLIALAAFLIGCSVLKLRANHILKTRAGGGGTNTEPPKRPLAATAPAGPVGSVTPVAPVTPAAPVAAKG